MEKTQQEFLREASIVLGLSQKEFAKRMGASWKTFEKWLLSSEIESARKMPAIGWALVNEILEHEQLKKSLHK